MKIPLSVITKQTPNSPIGVFDSGLGGLTVLKSLEKILPNESFIYWVILRMFLMEPKVLKW